jgi:hypothetical protein
MHCRRNAVAVMPTRTTLRCLAANPPLGEACAADALRNVA